MVWQKIDVVKEKKNNFSSIALVNVTLVADTLSKSHFFLVQLEVDATLHCFVLTRLTCFLNKPNVDKNIIKYTSSCYRIDQKNGEEVKPSAGVFDKTFFGKKT